MCVCQPFQCCVQVNVHMRLFWQGFSFTSFRLIIGTIRVSKILGKLCCITLVIKKLSLHITLHGFLKHMYACLWTHSQNFSLHFSFLVLPVYFAHSQTSSLTGEVSLIVAFQQLRSELAELRKKTKIPKVFDVCLWAALCSGMKVSCIENVTWMSGIAFQAAEVTIWSGLEPGITVLGWITTVFS